MDSVKGGGQLILNAQSRRPGVLLLIVVCKLTLFLMLGATYLAVARRARMASSDGER